MTAEYHRGGDFDEAPDNSEDSGESALRFNETIESYYQQILYFKSRFTQRRRESRLFALASTALIASVPYTLSDYAVPQAIIEAGFVFSALFSVYISHNCTNIIRNCERQLSGRQDYRHFEMNDMLQLR